MEQRVKEAEAALLTAVAESDAARQYREMVQQYNNSLKLLLKISGDLGEVEEDSPLRQWGRMQNGEE